MHQQVAKQIGLSAAAILIQNTSHQNSSWFWELQLYAHPTTILMATYNLFYYHSSAPHHKMVS